MNTFKHKINENMFQNKRNAERVYVSYIKAYMSMFGLINRVLYQKHLHYFYVFLTDGFIVPAPLTRPLWQ